MKRRKIKVGLDFDGVVAYNPFRVLRSPLAYFKRNILGIKKLKFWYPQAPWQKIFWIIIHESSIFPASGVNLLSEMVKDDLIEAHLITARYSFLDDHLYRWLDKYKIRKLFKTVTLNQHDEQPHLFKEKIIEKLKLNFFIEDNWDIVKYLSQKSKVTCLRRQEIQKCKIYWIYNITDHFISYPHKYPYLEKALQEIKNIL